MNILNLAVGGALTITVLLGMMVFRTNPQRPANRQFFLLSLVIAAYLISLWLTFTATDATDAGLFLRVAHVLGMGVLFSFNLLRLAIRHREDSLGQLLRRSGSWLAVMVATFAVTFSPFFISGMVMPSAAAGILIPAPIPEWGHRVVNGALVVAVAWLTVSFLLDARRVEGIQRAECQYLAVASIACVATALAFAVLLPLAFGDWRWTLLLPLSFVVLDAITAYGIATRRILDVGEFLRAGTAYGLITAYLLALYGLAIGAWQTVSAHVVPLPTDLGHVLAALLVAFSFVPAHGLMHRFASKLFISVHPVDIRSTLTDANRVLRSLQPLDELLHYFTAVIGRAVGSDQVRILLQAAAGDYRQLQPLPAGAAGLALAATSPLVHELALCQEPVARDVLHRTRPSRRVQQLLGVLGDSQACVSVGIRSKDRLEGVLLLGRRLSGRIYSKTDLEALQLLTDQLGVAIENARLYTELQQRKRYNETVLENLVSGVVAVDADGRLTTCNREAARLLGVAAADLVGTDFRGLPEPLVQVIAATRERGEEVRDTELALPVPAGEPVPVRVGSVAFGPASARVREVLAVFHDVSAIRRLEQQVRQTNRLASIGTMAAGMAHEIKNPLVAIKTFTQLLPERYDDEEFRTTFSTLIGSEVCRIDSIVNQLLAFARPAAPILTRVHVHELISNVVALFQPQFAKRGILVHCRFEAAEDAVVADANQLQQAVMNLVLNAIEAMERKGTLTLGTAVVPGRAPPGAAPGRLAIAVSDTGSGIPPEHLARIFDPFFTTKANGTGLGLAVTHRIVEDHHGALDVTSRPGQGTTFRLALPLAAQEECRERAS